MQWCSAVGTRGNGVTLLLGGGGVRGNGVPSLFQIQIEIKQKEKGRVLGTTVDGFQVPSEPFQKEYVSLCYHFEHVRSGADKSRSKVYQCTFWGLH